jgi:hypothetical protein
VKDMPSTDDFRINLNQNLWGLVLSLAALGAAEHFNLPTLYKFAVVIAIVMSASVAITTFSYTVKYWKKKWKD